MSKASSLQRVDFPHINTSGITPIEYKVLVKPVEEKGFVEFDSGFKLYKPDETKERDQHAAMEGEIIACSPFAFSYEEWPEGAEKPRAGQRVIFNRYSGVAYKGRDGVEYRLMNDKDIMAVLA